MKSYSKIYQNIVGVNVICARHIGLRVVQNHSRVIVCARQVSTLLKWITSDKLEERERGGEERMKRGEWNGVETGTASPYHPVGGVHYSHLSNVLQ